MSHTIVIPDSELTIRASRSGGPGGQHVNTSSTRVEVAWNVRTTTALSDEQRVRALRALATRVDSEGLVRVVSSETRSQRQNKELALERLHGMIVRALHVPKVRRKTKPHRGAVEKRIATKKKHSRQKRERHVRDED